MKRFKPARNLLAAIIGLAACSTAPAATPAYTTLLSFDDTNGGFPREGLTIGPDSVLYGATPGAGYGLGNVFSLTPPSSPGGPWTQDVLYSFTAPSGGTVAFSGVVRSPAGLLYGTTAEGGAYGWGVVYSLTPPASAGQAWTEKVLYSFTDGSDGGYPTQGVVLGADGKLYGATIDGGTNQSGVVFELTPPSAAGDSWTESVLYNLTGYFNHLYLTYGGSLYGTIYGPNGAVFSLTPPASGGTAWTFNTVYSFTGGSDGGEPAYLIAAADGMLYGTTTSGGAFGKGTVFSLTPPITSGDPWTQNTIYDFSATEGGAGGPLARVPGTGILYGATYAEGDHYNGAIFQLKPPSSTGGSWTYTILHYFPPIIDDYPVGGLTLGDNVLYGETFGGGTSYDGTVFALQL